jgi:threonine/homoserine/homoserine lactone efflux protein
MTADQAIAYMTFALIGAVTPGPSNVMISATGSAVGFVRGLPCALGAAIGMASLLFGAALGLGQIVVAQPMLLNTMNVAGSAFMLWLAWKIATAGPGSETQRARPVGLIGAAVFQWANPKGWLVAVSAAGTYLQATTDQLVQAVWFGSLFFVAALPSGLVGLA